MCPTFAVFTLLHFPQIVQGNLHQWRKIWFWGIFLLASIFWLRNFLGMFCFVEIVGFLVIFWPWITSASSPGSAVVEGIGNIFQSDSGYALGLPCVNWLVWVPALLLNFLILFCLPGADIYPTWFSKALFYHCYQYAKSSDCPHCTSGGEGVKNDPLPKYILIASKKEYLKL